MGSSDKSRIPPTPPEKTHPAKTRHSENPTAISTTKNTKHSKTAFFASFVVFVVEQIGFHSIGLKAIVVCAGSAK
jgi:hypothetical protein